MVLGLLALVLLESAGVNAATLEWGTSATANIISTTNSNNTTGITVTSHSVLTGSATVTSSIAAGGSNGSANGTIQLNMDATTDNSSAFITTTFTFSAPVVNLSFTVRDIDGGPNCNCWNDVVDFGSNNGVPTSGTPASGVSYTLATGRAQATQNTGINDATGNVTVTWSQPVTTVTVKYIAGPTNVPTTSNPGGQYLLIDDFTFNVMPKIQVNKISNGALGTFNFTGTNGYTSTNITTTVVGGTTTSAAQYVTALNTATDITETPAVGFVLGSFTCTGLGAGAATRSGNMITISAAAIVADASIVCTLTNERATVKVQKVSLGGFGGTVTFTQTNLTANPGSASTVAEATAAPASPVAVPVTALGSSVTITETPVAGYALTAATCSDANSAVTGNPASFGTFSGNVLTIPAARVLAGADITCSLTNTRPRIAVQKTTIGGFGGPFAFTQTNLVANPGNITTLAAATPTPAVPTPINVTTVGTAVTITEPAIGGFFITAATCSDLNAAITGNPVSFGTLASTVLTVPATNIRAGADIRCVFSNTKGAPALQILKTANTAGPLIQGQTVTYTYRITNTGNVPITGVTVADVHNGSGVFAGPNSEALVTDNAPAGDTTDAAVNSSWDVIGPGDVIRFTATYVVTLNDIETKQ